MWTNENRAKYKRDHLQYPSDLTDEEWAHVEPFIPPARRGGRRRETSMRAALNAVMYVLSTGCQWRYLPKDLPPRSTVYRYFRDWGIDGVLDRIHDALYEKCRAQAEREASPTTAIIDSQSVRSAEKGGSRSIRTGSTRKEDQRQETPSPRRHPRVADAGARSFRRRPGSRRRRLAAFDAAWPVPLSRKTVCRQRLSRPDLRRTGQQNLVSGPVEIVKRSDHAKGFVPLPKRWIVERTIACSTVVGDWPRTGRTSTSQPSCSFVSPPSASCCEGSAIPHELSS